MSLDSGLSPWANLLNLRPALSCWAQCRDKWRGKEPLGSRGTSPRRPRQGWPVHCQPPGPLLPVQMLLESDWCKPEDNSDHRRRKRRRRCLLSHPVFKYHKLKREKMFQEKKKSHLATQNCTVNTKTSFSVCWTVVNILKRENGKWTVNIEIMINYTCIFL